MNKGIKETKSETKRNKNVSKIATRIISERKRSPTRGKDRSLSMNSLVSREGAESKKKIVQKEVKPKMVNGYLSKKINEFKKSSDFSSSSSNDQRSIRSPENLVKTKEEIEDTSIRETKLKKKEKFLDQLIAQEGSIEKLLEIKKNANRNTVYNVNGMSSIEIRESMARVDDKIAKPFSFLNEMIHDPEEAKSKVTRDIKDQELNPTDIDVSNEINLQLASLVRRVELNRTLLEKTNQRIKDINFLTERNKMISIRDMNYDEESFLKIKEAGDTCKEPVTSADLVVVSHPAVDELKKTMSTTIEMLGYVHKMSSGDLAYGEISPELMDYLNTPIIPRANDI